MDGFWVVFFEVVFDFEWFLDKKYGYGFANDAYI